MWYNDNFDTFPKDIVGQTATDNNLVTIDSLQELSNALSNGTITDPLQHTV